MVFTPPLGSKLLVEINVNHMSLPVSRREQFRDKVRRLAEERTKPKKKSKKKEEKVEKKVSKKKK